MKNAENCVEFLVGDNFCTGSFTSQRRINRLKKLFENHKQDFCYMVENKDGSVCAKFPISWLKITPPTKREMTEDERQALKDRLAEARRKH